jgi:hypothetical protein
MAKFVGWRYYALIGGIVGSIAIAIYPIAIHPYLYPEQWRELFNYLTRLKKCGVHELPWHVL